MVSGLTGPEYLTALAKLPFAYQPGTTWEYGPGFDILGLAMERVTRQPISQLLHERVWKPLGMVDTFFTVPANKAARRAKPLPKDPLTGAEQVLPDQTRPFIVDCGNGCLASTTADYVRFAQMILNGGTLNGARVLSRTTVAYMTSDHTGSDMDLTRLHNFPSDHLYGHGFGLGVSVRREAGLGGAVGSSGTFHWSGAYGTAFWVDPVEDLVIVYMTQAPGAIRTYYRQLIPSLIYQALE
jgi:CubicO group peptidase (beta-lactamase class C family)